MSSLPIDPATLADDLLTVRDCLRFAVSRFRAAGIVHGHGATGALDEAAFLILEALSLPIDDVSPWLEARLTRAERIRILSLVEARVTTRQPAAYLVGRAYIQGIPFRSDRRAIVPRSFIGELLFDEGVVGEGALIDPVGVTRVLDLCTGGGSLAILAALVFPEATVDAVDLSPDALSLAAENVADHDLGDRVRLLEGDLFAPLGRARYDLILTNPPYVNAAEMALLPPEYRHEPDLALAGGEDGLDIVHRILDAAPRHLAPDGGLMCEIGTGRDALEASRPDLPFLWVDTAESEGEVFWLPASALR